MSRVPFYLPPGVNPQHVQDADGPQGRRIITMAVVDANGRWSELEIDGGPNTGTPPIYIPGFGEIDSAELTNFLLAYREKAAEKAKKNRDRPRRTSEDWSEMLKAHRERQESARNFRSTFGYHGALIRS